MFRALLTRNGHLPGALTSYDLLKSFALVTMVVDHIGAFLFPAQEEWRVIGRLSLPVWMFFVGYARTREIPPSLAISAGLVVASDFFFGRGVFPLDILVSIIIARLTLDFFVERAIAGREAFWTEVFVLAVLLAPTLYVFYYGTHGLLFALLGYVVRHRQRISAFVPARELRGFILGIAFIHSLTQVYLLESGWIYAFAVLLGVTAVTLVLSEFRPVVFAQGGAWYYRLLATPLQIMGRRSLELYVLHIILLKILWANRFWHEPRFFEWRWY